MFTTDHLNQALDPALWPRIDVLTYDESTASIQFSIPGTLSYFEGHFPQQAVLPGVVQVHWAGELAKHLFSVNGFSDLKSVKFNSMILPGNTVTLNLRFNADKGTVRFDYLNDRDKYSSGSLTFTGVNP